MRDVFKGFLRLRLFGFLALLIVVAVVVAISSLSHGSTVAGVAILAGVVVVTVAIGLLAWRSASRVRAPPTPSRPDRP